MSQFNVAIIADILDKDGNLTDRSFVKEGNLKIQKLENAFDIDYTANNTFVVTAKAYKHAFEAEGSAVLSDNFFIMLPGETKTVTYMPEKDFDKFDFTAYTILN